MIHLLQPTETGILDNRPVGERNPTLPRLIKCENPYEVLSLIEDFYEFKEDLDETNKEIVRLTQHIFYHLEMVESKLKGRDMMSDFKLHLDQIRDGAGALFAMGDV
jgi:hypothetical protein